MTAKEKSHYAPVTTVAAIQRLELAEQKRRTWSYVALAGDTLEDMCKPGFFATLAAKLMRYDLIEVTSDEDSFFALILVLDATPGIGVRVQPLFNFKFENLSSMGARGSAPRTVGELAGVHVAWKGPHLKWCVMNGATVLTDRHDTETLALGWMASHMRAVNKGAA